jgi:hypothetical protein
MLENVDGRHPGVLPENLGVPTINAKNIDGGPPGEC